MRTRSLRWWAVLVPTVLIILLDYARHKLIAGYTHPWNDEVVLLVGVLLVAFATSRLLFQQVDRSQQREQQAKMLYEIGVDVTSNLNLDVVLNSILIRGREALDADCLGIALADGPRRELTRQRRLATSPSVVTVSPNSRFPWETVETGEEKEQENPTSTQLGDDCPSCGRCLAIPLRMGPQLLGAMCVGRSSSEPQSSRQRTVTGQMAHLAAVAIANSLLHEHAQNLATLEERDRIAREIHDSLAQALGYLSMRAQGAGELLRRGETEGVQATLLEMSQVANEAYADVREAILGLRVSARAETGLGEILQDYLKKFSHQSGVVAELEAVGEDYLDLPPRVQIQLVRVIQEALTNVRKHSHARHVWVKLERQECVARITISDDGEGFDLKLAESRSDGHYGIATMRERLAIIGGHLEVSSKPEKGTVIAATVSLAGRKGIRDDHG